jgi:hypothetical protein
VREPAARPLRAIRHADDTAATLTAMRAICGAFGRPIPEAALDAILAILAARAGVLGVPPAPFEISLKRTRVALAPRLRVVEYSPRARRGLPSREERAPRRRDRLIEIAAGLGAGEARAWAELLSAEQPPGLELSLGIDADIERGDARAQLYAHLEPRDRARMEGVVLRAIAWSGAGEEAAATARALLQEPGADAVLLALSPAAGDPRRLKIYFSRRLDAAHAPSALAAADLGALAPFAPATGLAVLACEGGAARWEKWDFPCALHFQRASALAPAFAAGLPDAERTRALALLDGRRFTPWPTWLSVGGEAAALYFVPR